LENKPLPPLLPGQGKYWIIFLGERIKKIKGKLM
jgi:hypothetical protein